MKKGQLSFYEGHNSVKVYISFSKVIFFHACSEGQIRAFQVRVEGSYGRTVTNLPDVTRSYCQPKQATNLRLTAAVF